MSSPLWNARSVYFRGPDGTVLESIARSNLVDDVDGPFGAHLLRGVSEVGLAARDVPAVAAKLGGQLGIPHFGEGSDQFAPMGDEHGLLILVAEGRPWFPTSDSLAHAGPSASVDAGLPGIVTSDGWTVTGR